MIVQFDLQALEIEICVKSFVKSIHLQALQYIVRLSELLNICSSGFWDPSMGEASDHIYQTKPEGDPYTHIYHID